MSIHDPFHKDIVECLPHLRAFAQLLARNHTLAQDLVQETVLRALTYRDQFKPGTNLRGWLIIILRNRYFNEVRKNSRRRAISVDNRVDEPLIGGGQDEYLEMQDFKRHFHRLPEHQKEALLLVGVNGYSYEEAASIAGCAVGTMKSRVSRSRRQLQSALLGEIAGVPEKAKPNQSSSEEAVTPPRQEGETA